MVTLHEIIHAELNDSTAWGSLFHACAVLVQHAPDPAAYRDVSLSVIEACRRTHEVFATYTGAFLADRAAGQSLLAGRPEYLAHYVDACQLAGGSSPRLPAGVVRGHQRNPGLHAVARAARSTADWSGPIPLGRPART